MIYFDNAASGGFKPDTVFERATFAMKNLLANPGRSGHGPSIGGEKLLFETRKKLSKYLNNGHIGRLILTDGCTSALNFAILGAPIDLSKSDVEIVTTVSEHNSVLRPLYKLSRERGVKLKFAPLSPDGSVCAKEVLNLVTKNTALVVMNAVSNVTGTRADFEGVGKALCGHIPLVVDGAQLGGHEKPDLLNSGVSAMALAGHKGLFAYQGVGVLGFTHDFDPQPITLGGSGGDTFMAVPASYPEILEAGTRCLPAIASLFAGIDFVNDNIESGKKWLLRLTGAMIDGLNKLDGIKIYSRPNHFGIVAFEIEKIPSIEAANILWEKFSLCVRGGFHCAPLMHKALKTADNGLIRASLSQMNTLEEIEFFLYAVRKLSLNLL